MRLFITFPQKNRQLIKDWKNVNHPDWVKLVIIPNTIYEDWNELIKTLNKLFPNDTRSDYFEYDKRDENKQYYPLWIL